MTAGTRVRIANRAGQFIAELVAEVQSVGWKLKDVGQARIRLAKTDSKVDRDILSYGNRVLIEFENGLQNFSGVIDPPMSWDEGSVTVTVLSAEQLLDYVLSGKNDVYNGATVGAIFADQLEKANERFNFPVAPGDIWTGGGAHTLDLHFERLLGVVRNTLCSRLSNADFEIEGREVGGGLKFFGNLHERQGRDVTDRVRLEEDVNLGEIQMSEQGPIRNYWRAVAQGSDWGDERFDAVALDQTSQSLYGVRMDALILNESEGEATPESAAAEQVKRSRFPYRAYRVIAHDQAPGLFQDYQLGDIVQLVLPSYGFGGIDERARVAARSYYPTEDICQLTLVNDGIIQ